MTHVLCAHGLKQCEVRPPSLPVCGRLQTALSYSRLFLTPCAEVRGAPVGKVSQ